MNFSMLKPKSFELLFNMRRIWDTRHACGPMKQKQEQKT